MVRLKHATVDGKGRWSQHQSQCHLTMMLISNSDISFKINVQQRKFYLCSFLKIATMRLFLHEFQNFPSLTFHTNKSNTTIVVLFATFYNEILDNDHKLFYKFRYGLSYLMQFIFLLHLLIQVIWVGWFIGKLVIMKFFVVMRKWNIASKVCDNILMINMVFDLNIILFTI